MTVHETTILDSESEENYIVRCFIIHPFIKTCSNSISSIDIGGNYVQF